MGTAWALHGGMVAAEHLMGWGGGGGTDTDASRPSSAPDIQTLNSMQEFGAEQHFRLREPSRQPRTEYYRLTEDESEPRAQPPPRVQARPARPTRYPTGLNPAPLAQVLGQRLLPASDAASSLREVPRRTAPVLRGASQRERAGGRVNL